MFFWVVVMWAGWLIEAAVHRCIGSFEGRRADGDTMAATDAYTQAK